MLEDRSWHDFLYFESSHLVSLKNGARISATSYLIVHTVARERDTPLFGINFRFMRYLGEKRKQQKSQREESKNEGEHGEIANRVLIRETRTDKL